MYEYELTNLLREVSAINKKYEGIAEATGENFNIFRILKMETREVRTHSAFLAELLNTKGSHGQKDIFLKKFIEMFKIPADEKNDTINATVKVEEAGNFGRVDIIIKRGQGCEIIIENKIYAPDQYRQLISYKTEYPNCHLLYLTLDGSDPSGDSIKDENHDLKKGQHFFTMSYREGILEWLKICQKEAASHPLLRETIAQYINLIKHLTHQTMNELTTEEIVNIIIKPENFKAAESIFFACDEVGYKFYSQLRDRIMDIQRNYPNLKVAFGENCRFGAAGSSFWFYKDGWKHCIKFIIVGKFEYLRVGVKVLNENEPDNELNNDLYGKLKNLTIGRKLSFPDWVWVSDIGILSEISWIDIPKKSPEIENLVKTFLKIIEDKTTAQISNL